MVHAARYPSGQRPSQLDEEVSGLRICTGFSAANQKKRGNQNERKLTEFMFNTAFIVNSFLMRSWGYQKQLSQQKTLTERAWYFLFVLMWSPWRLSKPV